MFFFSASIQVCDRTPGHGSDSGRNRYIDMYRYEGR